MYCENVHHEEFEGFDIYLDFCEEHDSPDWDMTDQEKAELIEKIDDGRLLWFCAKVRACKNGIELGTDYLGACCYASKEDFMTGGYYEDMKNTAIREAREAIQKLLK